MHDTELPTAITWLPDCVIVGGHVPVGVAADVGSTAARTWVRPQPRSKRAVTTAKGDRAIIHVKKGNAPPFVKDVALQVVYQFG